MLLGHPADGHDWGDVRRDGLEWSQFQGREGYLGGLRLQLLRDRAAFRFALDGIGLARVHRTFGAVPSQHLVGVLDEVAVDVVPDGIASETDKFPRFRTHPGPVARFFAGEAFSQVDDVRDNIGIRECVFRQAYRAHQVGPVRQVFPHLPGLGRVHRVMRGNEGQHPARTQLVHRLGEEIVMNAAGQMLLSLGQVVGVVDGVVAEGNIRDRNVEMVVRDRRFLESHVVDRGIGELGLEQASRQGVQLDGGTLGRRGHIGRLVGQEAARTGRRFQHLGVGEFVGPKVPQPRPHLPDYFRRGVEGV